MLLDKNSKKVIDLIQKYDNLSDIDKIRLAIYLLENKNFNVNFNVRDMIILLKQVLNVLDPNYTKVITNFSKYKHLLFFSAKYLELNEKEKKHFSVEMIFNIFFGTYITFTIFPICFEISSFDFTTSTSSSCEISVATLTTPLIFPLT